MLINETTSPNTAVTNSTLRRMKARIKISPISTSLCTKAIMCCRSSSITLPGLVTRARKRARRPESILTSPVNSPEPCTVISVSTAPHGRTISISPESTTKDGQLLSPCSTSTSPICISRMYPRAAMRLICASVNFGNMCSTRALVTGSPLNVSFMSLDLRVTASHKLSL